MNIKILKTGLILSFFVMSLACSSRMSVEEAKSVTSSFVGKGFTPPPRKITDITQILSRKEAVSKTLKRSILKAKSQPSKDLLGKDLAIFYFERGVAKIFVGTPGLDDFQKAYEIVKNSKRFLKTKNGFKITWILGKREFAVGNAKKGLELMELAKSNFPRSDSPDLVSRYASIGDFDAAQKAMQYTVNNRLKKRNRRKRGNRDARRITFDNINISIVTADILEYKGKFKKAEPYRRKALKNSYKVVEIKSPFFPVNQRLALSKNLMKQQRLVEAEIEIRKALKDGLKVAEKSSMGRIITTLSMILAKQGRLKESEELIRKLLQILKEAGFSKNSGNIAKINVKLAQILVVQKKWSEALKHFKIAQRVLKGSLLYPKFFLRNGDFALTLIKTGDTEKGIELLKEVYEYNKRVRGVNSGASKRILSFLGVAYAVNNQASKALTCFQGSVPHLLKSSPGEEINKMKIVKRRIVLTSYIDLLVRIKGTPLEKKHGIDSISQAFIIANLSRSQTVQAALAKSGVRASMDDPEMADFSRRQQDAQMQVQALKVVLSEHLSLPYDQQNPAVIKKLSKDIKLLERAQVALGIKIEELFPDYAKLSSPKQVGIKDIKSKLQNGETLISYFVTEKHTYIWGIPKDGDVAFVVSKTGKKEIEEAVQKIRKSLDIPVRTFGDIPEFDVKTSSDLYSKLLKPVLSKIKNTDHLIVIGHSALNQIPFSLLVTEPYKLKADPEELFSKYRSVPWLIKKMAITNLSSVNSLISLRSLPENRKKRIDFIGFGDPLFNSEQYDELKNSRNVKAKVEVKTRGLRVTKNISLDNSKSVSATLEMLQRLPDTSEEVLSIASILSADLKRDVFLNIRASEKLLKSMDLSNRKIILFSTHALVAGDLDGLHQPAIALSSPTITGSKDDGLLTMDEIMGLRLNSEWVVLSACNTAAASGEGAEAISGLGRAFFYAGTRAVLVSNWSVETTSAKRLVTNLFRYRKENPSLSRAKALQRAELKLIKEEKLTDRRTKKIVLSYAHPLFWAPFTIFGDGGK